MPGKKKEVQKDEDFPEFEQNDMQGDELGDENMDDPEAGGNAAKDASSNKTKWVDPTHEEISGYQQAEQLFKSSLLQLQITELRGEVNVDYAKLTGLEEVQRAKDAKFVLTNLRSYGSGSKR